MHILPWSVFDTVNLNEGISHHIEHKRQSLKKFSLFLYYEFECVLFHDFLLQNIFSKMKKDLGYDTECKPFLHMNDKSVDSEKATVHFFSLS